MIVIGLVASAAAVRLGLQEMILGIADVELAAVQPGMTNLPAVDVLVLASPALLVDLPEDVPPVLLLADNVDQAAPLTHLPVWGILPLEASESELSAALHALAEGLAVGPPALVSQLFGQPLRTNLIQNLDGVDQPTARERQVLQLAAEGLANKEIAAMLNISEHTVKFHLSALYAKLGVSSRTEAVRAGTRKGWVIL